MTLKLNFGTSIAALLFVRIYAWTYERLDEWPATCQSGKKQSPIALSDGLARNIISRPLCFNHYHNGKDGRTLENNGHTVEVLFKGANKDNLPTLSGGRLEGDYVLHNVHFHWHGEHTINGRKYPLEAHYVHYKKRYGSLENSTNYPDGLVVLGVMFVIADSKNIKLDSIVDSVPAVAKKINTPTEMKKGFEADGILPKNKERYYIYSGSLTTPDCNEVVTWIVFEHTVSLSQKQLNVLSSVYTEEGKPLTKNSRPLQKLNGRAVYYNTRW